MCAVIGIYSGSELVNISDFQALLLQSKVRGKHATGAAWIENGELKTYVIPESAEQLELPEIRTRLIIGHCRYSTSDLNFNQPIYDGNLAIAHNGVVTQQDSTEWPELYGMDFKTRCDSEILLRHYEKGVHPLNVEGSMAALILNNIEDPSLIFFRNGERPLYFIEKKPFYYIASTQNILKRAGIGEGEKTIAGVSYLLKAGNLKAKRVKEIAEDLQ